ncbi:MAG: sigma-54-dependent Fis family transcriptional regulator [Deltaproteobacteria bacterium]|nr:sigma-54-dependent Fis family transcriptional regulator [Deltaproteobacteria bacterium]
MATLKICGNLRIEQAMRDCINTIQDLVPVGRMFLQIYEPDLGAMRTVAMASPEEGKQLDLLTPMPRAARETVQKNLKRFLDGAVVIDSPERNPVAREMLRFHGIEGWSVMRMTLSTDNGRLGGVVLTAEGPDRYVEEHTKLVGLLKKPFAIALANTLEHREVLKLRDRLADDNQFLQRELHRIHGDEIVGSDFGLKEVMRMVRQVAPTESPVLLTGETGVGKDVVAGAIHLASARRSGPFIAVNCGAIPETLLDSELFGHEKGAFTGALAKKRGRFERAHEGTIFLDEIGEMPLTAQVRLLRVLQNREIERIGGTERIPVDIRILAATNKDLEGMVKAGGFREDLWFRLNVFPMEIPPLRERTGDIPALVQHFIERKARELKLGQTPALATGAIEELMAYPWPGNVRELENLIERAMILCRDEPLQFNLNGPASSPVSQATPVSEEGALRSLDEIVEEHIRRALELAGGKIHGTGGAGEMLEMNPNTLRHRMKKYGIPFKKNVKT